MPFLAAIGGWLLQKALPWIWHQVSRAWGVFLVGAVIVIILMRWGAFKNTLYEKGYHAGYNQALTDHPATTVQAGGTSNTFINPVVKTAGPEINGWGLGLWHRR